MTMTTDLIALKLRAEKRELRTYKIRIPQGLYYIGQWPSSAPVEKPDPIKYFSSGGDQSWSSHIYTRGVDHEKDLRRNFSDLQTFECRSGIGIYPVEDIFILPNYEDLPGLFIDLRLRDKFVDDPNYWELAEVVVRRTGADSAFNVNPEDSNNVISVSFIQRISDGENRVNLNLWASLPTIEEITESMADGENLDLIETEEEFNYFWPFIERAFENENDALIAAKAEIDKSMHARRDREAAEQERIRLRNEEIERLIEAEKQEMLAKQENLLSRLPDGSIRTSWETDLDSEDDLDGYFHELECAVNWHEAKPKASSDDTNYNHLTADEILNGNFYLLGDICYFRWYYHLRDLYEEIKEETGKEPAIVTFGTGGDGGFSDQHGRFYTVESGTFGIMDAKLLSKEDIAWHLQRFQEFEQKHSGTEFGKAGYGHFVKLENGNVYVDENKHVWFGNHEIVIDANCMWDCANSLDEGPLTGFDE